MQCICNLQLHFSEICWIQKTKKQTEVLKNYTENTLTKKSFSETWYDSYNNYTEKDISIVTTNSTVTVNVSLSFHKIHGLNK